MENARSTTRDSLSRQVKKIIELHPDTIICTETNNYSQYLEELFLCKVYRLAHPVTTYSPAATRQSVRLKSAAQVQIELTKAIVNYLK